MSGDGVSLPTTLSQLGQVAKAQARSQQTAAPAGAQTAQEKDELQPVQKVKEAEKKGKGTVGRRQEGEGRPRREAGVATSRHDPDDPDGEQEPEPGEAVPGDPGLGGLIDTKA
jgi:hypothetical protein